MADDERQFVMVARTSVAGWTNEGVCGAGNAIIVGGVGIFAGFMVILLSKNNERKCQLIAAGFGLARLVETEV